MSEDNEDDLKLPVQRARDVEGGQHDVKAHMMSMFDDITDLEARLSLDKENNDIQVALATARANYRFTGEYDTETAAKQVGLTDEERADAE